MDKIEVTAPMRERILANLESGTRHKRFKVTAVHRLAMAACLVLAVCVTAVMMHLYDQKAGNREPEAPEEEMVLGGAEIVTQPSVHALEKAVGFEVEELENLPFTVEETTYCSYWGELAEITYTGSDQSAVYRKSEGAEDNSGDYRAYAEEHTEKIGSKEVLIKGEKNQCCLAVWYEDDYAYSVAFEHGITLEELETLLQ